MHELDRIDQALATKRLDAHLFERCATDLLIDVYPGLSPIHGGTDWGRDADVHGTINPVPPRLLVTSSRTVEGVTKNMVSGLKSLAKHNVKVERVVLANPAILNEQQREKLRRKACELNVTIDAFHDREFFVSRLRRDGEWRKALLDLPGEPITLSRTPSDLAESPWASVPLAGRDTELARLQASDTDVVLTGPPGVGKTRLVTALTNAVFVDVDAVESAQLANDLRWLQPELIVVDDAGQHLELVRRLTNLRRSESDLLSYRIICICWPDEIDALKDLVPRARQIDIPLLERHYIDQIVIGMGINGQLARHEIIDQAEGRPGWAITLADILSKTQRWDSLVDGRVLLGEVERYLRRARVGTEAIHLLTIIAALGGITDSHIPALAASLNLPVPATRKLLLDTAHGGILDSSSIYEIGGRKSRRYNVRPPMLADALVAEHIFRSTVPVINLLDLSNTWPAALSKITRSAITSTLMGADAKSVARELIYQCREESALELGSLARLYACIDKETGHEVLSWVRTDFVNMLQLESFRADQLETLVEIAALLARRYHTVDAVDLILDASMLDSRPKNRFSRHPLRVFEDLITDYHPDLVPAQGLRQLVADATDAWISRNENDSRAYEVYGVAVSCILSIKHSGHYLDAANRRQVNIVETIVSPADIKDVYEKVWPSIKERLLSSPPLAVRYAIDAATDWLRIGGGYDRPFGTEHPDDSIKAAKQFGTKMVFDLAEVVPEKPGLMIHLKRSTARFNIDLELQESEEFSVFFADIERNENWSGAASEAREKIKVAAASWATQNPLVVIQRLADLRSQLDIAHLNWPNRVEWACQAISELVPDPDGWVKLALEEGLFPEATPFLDSMLARNTVIPEGLIRRCFEESHARWRVIESVLSLESSTREVQYVLTQLTPSDFPALEAMAFRKKLSIERQRQLLTIQETDVRGAMAFALARPVHADDNDWPPAELESDWLSAIIFFNPAVVPQIADHQLKSFFLFLKNRYPATLADYMKRRVQDLASREMLTSHDELTQGLHLLPGYVKTQILAEFSNSQLRWLLLRYMPGDDLDWINGSLDRGLITIDEALRFRGGLGLWPEPSIADLAKLLVPRGMAPERVAAAAEFGIEWGEDSDRANKLINQFQEFLDSEDDSVAAVGRAGIEMYTKKRDIALERERIERIRGDL